MFMLCINKLYLEAVHPCGPAEGEPRHYRYCLAFRGIFKYVQVYIITVESEAYAIGFPG